MTSKEFLTTGEASKLVDISRSTIARNFDKGIFQGKKNPITGERLISRESLINFMKQYNVPVGSLAAENKRVLVGSPDDQFFSLLQTTLSEDDRVELERVVLGGDVLISCSKVRPDLLVLDEELPDISSMEIIRSLRRMGDQQALKIIGAGKVRSVRQCLDWGADEVLGKETLNREELAKTVNRVEVNGFPRRQDLDWELARLAVGAGCDFLLASDAHATTHLEFDAYACAIAIKAGIPRERVLNAGQVEAFTAWLAER